MSYRGYLICTHPWTGDIWIEKGGATIASGLASEEAARDTIDALLD